MALKFYGFLYPYVALAVIFQCLGFSSAASLYDPDDPLWELDSSNFNRIVYGKNNAWFIEFYNSWCGHCIRFTPTYKAFARDTENWKSVIDIGVVNCVEPENVKLCREYEVTGYPTLKLFGAQINETDKGSPLTGARDIENLYKAAITFLESQEFIPQNWPNLNPIKSTTINGIWDEESLDRYEVPVRQIYLVIEHPESFLGREVILDLSAERGITFRRVLTTNNELTSELAGKIDNSSLPLFLRLNKNGDKEILAKDKFSSASNDTFIRDTIYEMLVGDERVKDANISEPDKPTEKDIAGKGVHMADLENAVRYSLRQEVGVQPNISGDKLQALKSYLTALRTYFPGRPHVMLYLTKLHNWVINRKGNLTGERFIGVMDRLETDKEFLPEMQGWVGCKGSTPKYRGYPCSLWTLFHTLTVQAYNHYEDSQNYNKDPQKILFTIKSYVKNFFTCQDCSEHFLEMSENLENEVKNPKDTVLWLWQAHNQVNRRLAGDETEDPASPKVQFPPSDACRQCRVKSDGDTDIEWDTNAVLRYLQHYYKKERISQKKASGGAHSAIQRNMVGNADSQDSATVMTVNNSSFYEHWKFRWFSSTDISLCVSLYFVSALLLIVIYLFFAQRRRRRKSRYKKLVYIYP